MSFSSSSKEMPLRQHIEELRSRILRIVICVIIIIAFSMSFGIRPLVVGDSILAYYPYPDPFHNIAIQITKYMQETLLPHEVKLIQTAPGQAFFFSNICFCANWYYSLYANNCQGNIWFYFTRHRK